MSRHPAFWAATLCFFTLELQLIAEETSPSPLAVFEQRIMPIFASPKPSSCIQCHLASVDLKNYILPTSQATFQALRNQGLINVDAPLESKILQLIAMGDKDADQGAKLIHAKTRQAERAAFAAWIEACCQDKVLLASQPNREPSTESAQQTVGPEKPLAVVRYNRKDRLLDSFVRNIWSQRMRCFPCHTPHEIDLDNPMHKQPGERHADYVQEFGQKMNLFLETPEKTLNSWIASSRKERENHLPLINAKTPANSLILLKPTAKVPGKDENGLVVGPSSVLPVSHVGGLKMHIHDQSYKSFLTWLEDFARVDSDTYAEESDLPQDNWFPTEQVVRISDVSDAWPVLATVQVFVFAWDEHTSAWSTSPTAFTQALITPKRMVNGPLFRMASPTQKVQWTRGEMARLEPGKYLIRVCLDRNQQLNEHPEVLLHDAKSDMLQTEIEAVWKDGFKDAELIDGGQMK